MSAYVMASQPSPALPHTLPFISSPESTNTTPSTSAQHPPPSNSTPNNAPRTHPTPTYYHASHQDQHYQHDQSQQAHQKQHSDHPHEPSSDPDLQHQDSARPILETEGVVSSEVGAVPGILHQDLHPDGQPRRPMNAFMIFARHRRPAIQAKEPGLKTGEISKRLSHDWKNLPDEDKSHYLEQAKLLKDEFHNRFPEYVYKRRPNNTGKRRSSASQQQLQPKFSSAPAGPQMNAAPGGPSPMSGLPHPADMHHHPHHHAGHGDMYGPPQPAHHHHPLAHHHHPGASQPSRPPSSMTHPSPKMNGFYPPGNPSSPRYHQIGLPSQQLTNCSQPGRGPAAPHYAHSNGGPTSNGCNPHSRPPSPPPGHPGNGITSYLRLPQPLSQQHPSQYPWFANDQYGGGHQHHAVSTAVGGPRHGFYYPSWPPSGGENGSLQPDQCGQDHPGNHSRAASYSGGTGPYRPTSPSSAERARQLSLPSHTLTPTEPSYIKSEPGYTSTVIKTENPSASPYASAATPTASATVKAETQGHQQQISSAPSSAYPNYPSNPPADARSYSTSSTSPVGPSFAGQRGLFSNGPPIPDTPSSANFDNHQSPLLPESHSDPTPQPQSQQASSVAY